jgi:hypothetical protein
MNNRRDGRREILVIIEGDLDMKRAGCNLLFLLV